MQQNYKLWTATVEGQNQWKMIDRGDIEDPRTLDPVTHLLDNTWLFVAHDDYEPEWHHRQYRRGCRFTARNKALSTALFQRVIRMWADDRSFLQKTEVVAISRDGQLQVWTVRQTEDEKQQTLTILNENQDRVRFVRDHERQDTFHATHSLVDAYCQNHSGALHESIRAVEAAGIITHDTAESGRRFHEILETGLNTLSAREALAKANLNHPVNVLDLHHQRAPNIAMILDQHILERFAAIRADTSLPQVLTIISGRGNGSREFHQSPVKAAVQAYLETHHQGAYTITSRGGAFDLQIPNNDLDAITRALSRL